MDAAWRQELCRLLGMAKGPAEVGALLNALLTLSEKEDLARRWQIVKQLMAGVPQREIRDKLKVSIATVTRGSRELRYGNGTFQKLYARLQGR